MVVSDSGRLFKLNPTKNVKRHIGTLFGRPC
jgi:hypothetical protein